jgi:hypothetical protein
MTARSTAPQPVLLGLITIVATFFALCFVIAALTLARGNHGYMINYQHVTSGQFHARARALVTCLSMLAVYMAAIAFALRKRLSSSRTLLLAYFAISCLAYVAILLQVLRTPRVVDLVGPIIFAILGTLAAHWYLYRKPGVVAYYRAIEGRGDAATR